MLCASNCLPVKFSCLTLSSQCRYSDYTFFPLNDCPSYDSPVLQFRLAIQKEGKKPAPDMDIHISLHLTALAASICGGRRSWKCWSTSSPVKSILPQSPCLALTRFHVLPTRLGQVSRTGQGCPSPPCHTQPTPQCRNKAPCSKNTH